MDGYILDTNMVGHFFCGHRNVVAKIDSLHDETPILISAITLGEIEFGNTITHSTDHERRAEFQRWINNDLLTLAQAVLPITKYTRTYYGELKAELFRLHPPKSAKENHPERCIHRATGAELGIDENDLWIAAQALERNLVLVTNDEMVNIKEVCGNLLSFEDWTKDSC